RRARRRSSKMHLITERRLVAPEGALAVMLGAVLAIHTVRGTVRRVICAFGCHPHREWRTVQVEEKAAPVRAFSVASVRLHSPGMVVKLQGVDSLAQAQALRESIVLVEETQLASLREGEFYYCQVIGLKVRTQAGEEVGTIAQVFFSGGHDVWVVRR